ncbi:MAG: LTA synthase family protein [Sphingobacteriia bacterium]|jgi:phosphoglycerol transferase MdoB-like AlkP superfamily enzyme|nr:LTA synthase family protein [Sphingobacteriia bacterium]
MKNSHINFLWNKPFVVVACNFLLVMALFSVCRLFFFLIYNSTFVDVTFTHLLMLCRGGLRFDLSALLLCNSLYLLLMLLPFHVRENLLYQRIVRIIFLSVNSVLLLMNCVDMAYFPFTNRRTTVTVFSEFQHDANLLKIIGLSIFQYWYITLFCIILIVLLFVGYRRYYEKSDTKSVIYYPLHTVILLVSVYFTVIGIRGGFGAYTRPINISNAAQYVNRPIENAIVLNTPFCFFSTINQTPYQSPHCFSEEELPKIYTPIHSPQPMAAFRALNVVVIIMESFSKEYIGFFNHDINNGAYQGYTPFLDSLLSQSRTFKNSFAAGRKSIDAMPSVLSSIPMFIEPYILTPYVTNQISSIADVLNAKGYYSAFFHGAPNGSMGFEAFAKAAGFTDYYGMTEYGNDRDFDGVWAIWDEEFFQFFADKMGTFRQPFITTIFSASSHHPFAVPKRYAGCFPEGTHPIHQCIGYSDNALRLFFEKMARYPWYENTLFVFTSDHTNAITQTEYATDKGAFEIPIFYYHPGSQLRGMSNVPTSQTDILPSVLGYLNYDNSYFAFGNDVLTDTLVPHRVINYNNGFYQLFTDSLMLRFDGYSTTAVYNFIEDKLLRHNIKDSVNIVSDEQWMKAVIQQYIERMINNQLTVKP